MKKINSIYTLLIALLLISGCSSSSEDKAKQRPSWIDHASQAYPDNIYLSAVGQGSNRERATKKALSNLVEVFSVNVKAETKTLIEGVKTESALGVSLESSSTIQRNIETETEQAIQGAEIKETWLSPTGEYYALAVLHRISVSQNLTELIVALDQETVELIDYSINSAPNSILSINALRTARDKQVTRKMADVQLKHLSGSGVPNQLSTEKVELLIKQKLAAIDISVDAQTASQKTAIQAAVSRLGVNLVDQSSLEISGSTELTAPSYIDSWYWLRGSYLLTIKEQGQVISAKRWPIKVSAKQKELLMPRLNDKLESRINEYLQSLISDAPTL